MHSDASISVHLRCHEPREVYVVLFPSLPWAPRGVSCALSLVALSPYVEYFALSLVAMSPARCILCSPRCHEPREVYSVLPSLPWAPRGVSCALSLVALSSYVEYSALSLVAMSPARCILCSPRCHEPREVYPVLPLATCRYLSVVLGTSTQTV